MFYIYFLTLVEHIDNHVRIIKNFSYINVKFIFEKNKNSYILIFQNFTFFLLKAKYYKLFLENIFRGRDESQI